MKIMRASSWSCPCSTYITMNPITLHSSSAYVFPLLSLYMDSRHSLPFQELIDFKAHLILPSF